MKDGIFMGIDPGIADAGFGVVQMRGGKEHVLTYGSIQTPAGMPMQRRLLALYTELSSLLATYKPEAVGIEKLFFSKNVKTAISVAEARGVIRLCIALAGVPCMEFNPADVKNAVCGHGGATKEQVQKMVQILLRLKEIPKPDDAADALGLAVTTAHSAAFAASVRK